jgi:23S rRNA pseudouridine2605 synthase
MELLPKLPARVYPVGRLDAETEGALLLANDGETAHRLTHPRYEVPKVYEALVEGQTAEGDLDKLRRGLFLEGRRTAPAKVRVLRRGSHWTLVGLEIHEGRKREIRKLLEAVGHRVTKLRRVAFAGLTLEGLKPGQWRFLKKKEIDRLRALVARRPPR